MKNKKFTGERLVPNNPILIPSRIENLARFNFFLKYAQGKLVLDLGCGIGEGTYYVSEHTSWKVIGIDISLDALQTGKEIYYQDSIDFLCMDAQYLSLRSNCFDSIISVEVIEHISNPDLYLAEVFRVLQPNGMFMLTTPNQLRSSPTPGSLWPEHLREYTPKELKILLEKHFSSVEIWGQDIPIYENHPLRKLIRTLAPLFKPILPRHLRVRTLPFIQTIIKSDISIRDIRFSTENIQKMSSLIALCQK